MINGRTYKFIYESSMDGKTIHIGTKFKVTKDDGITEIQLYDGFDLSNEERVKERSIDLTNHRKNIISKYLMCKFVNK